MIKPRRKHEVSAGSIVLEAEDIYLIDASSVFAVIVFSVREDLAVCLLLLTT